MKKNPIKTFEGINLSHKTIEKNAPKTIGIIKSILDMHKNEKGIIHTVSNTCKDYLINNLDNQRLIDHNTQNRIDQLNRFKNSNDSLVLISPSMNEGVDLPGKLCSFQII